MQRFSLSTLHDPQQMLTLFQSIAVDLRASERQIAALEARLAAARLTESDLRTVQHSLQAGSPFSLNVANLLGVLAQSQRGYAVVASSLGGLPNPDLYELGTLGLVDDGSTVSIYYVKDAAPRTWYGPVTLADAVTLTTAQNISGAKTFSVGLLLGNTAAGVHVRSELGFTYEELTLSTSGATTDTAANMIKASLNGPVCYYVSQTISGGGVTNFRGGDATTADRFWSADSNLTAGNGGQGVRHFRGSVTTDATGPTNTADAKLRVTCDATPTQGKVQLIVPYWKGTFV